MGRTLLTAYLDPKQSQDEREQRSVKNRKPAEDIDFRLSNKMPGSAPLLQNRPL
jgi:hypothetical protein